MIELPTVQIDTNPKCVKFLQASGHDMDSLLYDWLDKVLFCFATEEFITRDCKILEFHHTSNKFHIKAEAFGETFNREKHEPGTEVKAITYSNMQIYDPDAASGGSGAAAATGGGGTAAKKRAEVYVIVDI